MINNFEELMKYIKNHPLPLDSLDEIEHEDKRVQVLLKSGEIITGVSDCIVYDEDEDGEETIKNLRFIKDDGSSRYIYLDEVESYESISK